MIAHAMRTRTVAHAPLLRIMRKHADMRLSLNFSKILLQLYFWLIILLIIRVIILLMIWLIREPTSQMILTIYFSNNLSISLRLAFNLETTI